MNTKHRAPTGFCVLGLVRLRGVVFTSLYRVLQCLMTLEDYLEQD